MPKLCCFLHPEYSADEGLELTDRCATCGKEFGFTLSGPPTHIGKYEVIKPLDRGFYSVTYIVKTEPFGREKVLKVAFKATYDKFNKDFEAECKAHAEMASGSQHIVDIGDMQLDVGVTFGEEEFICHLAELDYVSGDTLRKILESTAKLSARSVAQIAIDLFSLLQELQNKNQRHNDLQPANLIVERLPYDRHRANAEDPGIRVVAIDLNSASDQSRSDAGSMRLGDLHWVVTYLKQLVSRLLSDPANTSDLEYRLASLLEERAAILSPDILGQRTPSFEECIEDIRTAIRQASSPWRDPPRLRRFSDAYNAQTLDPWYVPYLLVDPEERWLASICTPGPQVVVGMRGCGKTMLLRAVEFHARVTTPNSASQEDAVKKLRDDRFIGLYASSTRLLDTVGSRAESLKAPYVRLLIQYALQALRAVRHLQEVAPNDVVPAHFRSIAQIVGKFVRGAEGAKDLESEYEFERYLLGLMVRINSGEDTFELVGHPSTAFPQLAEATCSASGIWSGATVFFLLDDVSTRYLQQDGIKELMSALLFSDPKCAFKLTTEAQTLEIILRSPGQIERAREGRDYQVFDLGAEVNTLIKSKQGHTFVESVLAQRAKHYPHHPQEVGPKALLGDDSLESIAEWISTTGKTSRERKRTYHGLSALAGVCVGDIGDVISLYEMILQRGKGELIPISEEVQSECYQAHCSRRLYDLNRRGSWLREHAFAFAKASHALLMKSQLDHQQNPQSLKRLRQYSKLYVRLPSGNSEGLFDKLRDLIDAGVFVLDGGSARSKTRDTDPFQQFKLTYRKLYGISHYIGLAERDRFELSGDDLAEWLNNPARGEEILVRNLAAEEELAEVARLEERMANAATVGTANDKSAGSPTAGAQRSLRFALGEEDDVSAPGDLEAGVRALIEAKTPAATVETIDTLSNAGIQTVLLGLGFEERTSASVQTVVNAISPSNAVLVKYLEAGRAEEIRGLLWRGLQSVVEVPYTSIGERFSFGKGPVLVDVTGLAKPIIFHSVRNALRRDGEVWICRTRAASYYPEDEAISRVLEAQGNQDSAYLLAELSKILTGEQGPYSIDPLLTPDADESRRRMLCAFSSPKHERLLTLLDQRTSESTLVMTHNDQSPRGKMARIAAELASQNHTGAFLSEYASDDLQGVLSCLVETYQCWFTERGCNFELGLTGSKLQAVACAALSAAFKVSQCWYVRPAEFDAQRFTEGVGETTVLRITLSADKKRARS